MRYALPLLLLLAACSRDPKQVSVKLAKITTWPLSPAEADTLDDGQRANLAQRGITVQGSTIVFPELPLVGYWVEIDGARFMTDDNAVVTLRAAEDAVGTVYEDYESTTVLGTFRVGDVAALPAPARVEVKQELPSPGEMNPEVLQKMRLPASRIQPQSLPIPYPDERCAERDFCTPADNTMACCVDYDNPVGNGKAYYRLLAPECSAFATANFFQSTCFNWTAVSVCADEGAFGRGPNCWVHHKWRNCQNLSLFDFSATVTGSTTVRPGGTTTIKIRNNLPSNDSVIGFVSTLEDSGTLSRPTLGAELKKANTLYVVNHYETLRERHVEETELTYTAPPKSALPAFCTTIDVELNVIARTFEPVADVLGLPVPKFPVLRHEKVKLTIDCGGDRPPDLHLSWNLTDHPGDPNISLASFNTGAEIDLRSTRIDPGSVYYEPSGGTVTFTYNPPSPDPNDPCSYSASIAPYQLPPPPPAFLSISSQPPASLFSAGAVVVTIILQKECPDPMGGMTITDVITSEKTFPIMNIAPMMLIGGLQELEAGPLTGMYGDPTGETVEWTLSKK